MDSNLDNISHSLNPRDWKESMRQIQIKARDLDILTHRNNVEKGIRTVSEDDYIMILNAIKDIRNHCGKFNVDLWD